MDHMNYDQADVGAIHAFAAANNVTLREDAGILAARQLDFVRARVYEKKVPPMKGLSLVPMSSDVPEWAESVTTRSFDLVGMAKVVANYADDLPRADVAGSEKTVPVRTIGDSYGYNINELNASTALGARLPQRKANAARRAVEVKLNQIALVGDADYGLVGFTNHPNIGTTSSVTGDWTNAATTAENIVADVNTYYNAVVQQSKGVHEPNKLVLPLKALAAAQTKFVANTGKSAFQVIKETYPGLDVVGMVEFNGTAGSMTGFMGEFNGDNASLEMAMPFNQLPAQARNLELVVPCMARTGGVSVHYPLAFTKITDL